MPVTKLDIEKFLELSLQHPVIDVRSEGEYVHAHIPAAVSLPLFNNEERKIVGTTYKQISREDAIKVGLDYFGPKMREMVEFAEGLFHTREHQNEKTILVHCWRGGMRSAAVAWLLDLYGFKVYLLEGGYKAFRNWVLQQFQKDFNFKLIGGYTGSGKTLVLNELKKQGHSVIDLEKIAKHKGSAFGGLDNPEQPSTEMFENEVALKLFQLTKDNPYQTIWVEDESQRIGDLNMPIELWNRFRTKPLFFLDIPFDKRLDYIVADYGHFKKEALINAIIRIKKRLGGLETKTAINCLLEDDIKGCFEVLLKYYDKHYGKALLNRPNINEVMHKVEAGSADAKINTKKILELTYEPTTTRD